MKEVNVWLMSICKLALIRAVFDWSVVKSKPNLSL